MCFCQSQLTRVQKLLIQFKKTSNPGKLAEIEELLDEMDECSCDDELRERVDSIREWIASTPSFGGGRIKSDIKVYPGPKTGFRLVNRSGTSIFMIDHKFKPIQVGTIHEDPSGLYFFVASSLDDPLLIEGLKFEMFSTDIGDPAGWLAEPYEFWKIRAYNWAPAPTGDKHEGIAQKIVYVQNLTSWYQRIIGSEFGASYGMDPESAKVMGSINFTGMYVRIPEIAATLLSGMYGDYPEIIAEARRLLPAGIEAIGRKAYTGSDRDLIAWIRPRASKRLNEVLDDL